MIAGQMREAIASMEIPCANGDVIKMTVSIGVNTHAPTVDSSIDDFVSKACSALSDSKRAGRNIVCKFE